MLSAKYNPFRALTSTLRGRLVLLVCLATLPAVLFTLYMAEGERTATLKRHEDEGQQILRTISRDHLYQIAGAKSLLQWLADKLENDESISFLRDANYLNAFLSGYPQLGNIAVLEPNGNVYASARPLTEPINMFNYEAIQRALKSHEIETGGYAIGPIVKRPLLHLSKAVRDKRGNVRWVVFVALDLEYLSKLCEQAQLPGEQVLLIVDRDGTVLAHSKAEHSTEYATGKRVRELAEHENSQGGDQVRQPGAIVFKQTPLQVPGLSLAVSIPTKRIHAEANASFIRMTTILSLLTLSTVASVVFLEEFSLLRSLRYLSTCTRRFGDGDYSVRMKIPRGYGELERMADVFNTMAEQLAQRHQEIIASNAHFDKLTRHLQIARESECLRIARDLHDEVGQVLTSIKLDLSCFQPHCTQKDTLPCENHVDLIKTKLDDLISFIRTIASDLRPPVLDRMGLVKAIQLLARTIERQSDLMIEVEAQVEEPLDWLTSITVYRIVQESLTNVVRHAQATEATVRLSTDGSHIQLKVQDNGKGFVEPQSNEREALGILGMRERTRLINGTFLIYSGIGRGTTVEASIPQVQPNENAHLAS